MLARWDTRKKIISTRKFGKLNRANPKEPS